MREVWTLNLDSAPDGAVAVQADAVVSACAWSEDGLLAYASSAARPAAQAALCGYTSTPSIYVVHVDHPERHSQLSGGHEHDISHLSWANRQMGTVLMSADVRTSICLWKPVQVSPRVLRACVRPMQPRARGMGKRTCRSQGRPPAVRCGRCANGADGCFSGMFAQGLINRWELHHRLQFGPIKIAQFINQPTMHSMPPPYFPHSEEQLKVYRAAVPSTRPGAVGYDAKYRKDTAQRVGGAGAGAAGAKAAGESKALRNIPGCLCAVAVSSYGEARVFVEMAAAASAVEWSSASARLSLHELPDTSSRSARASAGGQEAGSQHAVVWVESAALTVRNGQLLLAVAEESQIMVFSIKMSYAPLKVTAIPHTRTQLKTDIRLQGLNAPSPLLSPSLVRMCFNPTKPEDLVVVYRMATLGPAGERRGGHMKLERLRLKDKPVPQQAPNAPAPAASDAEALNWQVEVRHVLTDGTSEGKGGKGSVLTHLAATADGQFAVLGFASGVVQLRWLDDLKEAPPAAYPFCLGAGVAEGRTWGALVQACSSPSGNCMLLLDAVGRAKVVEMPHPWAMHAAATPVCIANHLVHQLEVSMCKTSEWWDVLLPLGGLVRSHPQGMSILEAVLKQVADNFVHITQDPAKRFYRHMHAMLMLRLLHMSGKEEHVREAEYCQGRLLLSYLIDAFRFAIHFVAAGGVPAGGGGRFCSAAMARLKGESEQMMQALGPTIVALTVWNLHHAIKACEVDEALAQAGQEAPCAPGLGGGLRFRSIVSDVDALALTKDLLQYYYKQLKERNAASNKPAPAGRAQGAPGDASAAAVQGAGGTGAPSGAAAGAGMAATMTAPVMAPPPLAPESVDAPLPLDALDHPPQQDASGAMLEDAAADAESEAVGDSREMLQYDLEDVMNLIDIVDRLLGAHKATNQEMTTAGTAGTPDKTRILAQKLALYKLDLQHGLRQQLLQRSLTRPEFAHGALLSWLAISPFPHGFLARACGYVSALARCVALHLVFASSGCILCVCVQRLRPAASWLGLPSSLIPCLCFFPHCRPRSCAHGMRTRHERRRLVLCSCAVCAVCFAVCAPVVQRGPLLLPPPLPSPYLSLPLALCRYWQMQQEGGGNQSGAAGEGESTRQGNTGGMALKRSFQEYADEALSASCAQQGEAASRRRIDVLSRCRVQGRLQRECILSGLASATKVRVLPVAICPLPLSWPPTTHQPCSQQWSILPPHLPRASCVRTRPLALAGPGMCGRVGCDSE